MENENNFNEQTQSTQESTSFSFVTEEEAAQGISQESYNSIPDNQEEQTQYEEKQYQEDNQESNQEGSYQYSEDEVESAVLNFLSERLGSRFESLDDLVQDSYELDDRISAIADFVERTGRGPEEWFYYQSLNPSEMDDMTAIQVEMASSYPNLSQEEIQTLVSSKYKLDADLYSEDEVRLSQLQLKIDAERARGYIDEIREEFAAPDFEGQNQSFESPFNEDWVNEMYDELDSLEAIEFDLGNGNTFSFGLNDRYKNDLGRKNSNLDSYFDEYVRQDGSWNFDKLNMHRAVVDNVDSIVQSAYRQGMSDGQRGIVNKAANVDNRTPQIGNAQGPDPLTQQLKQALGMDNGMRFF
jgi:hypothetical protein